MIKNIKKVTIVGAGSAGWMTASMFIKTFPDWKIEIIESPDYPIVGVGESTLLSIREFFEYLDISQEQQKDMMRYTDASYKLSIKFTDFYDKNSGGFHYPFGSPVLYSDDAFMDWMVKKSRNPSLPVQDFIHSHFPASHLFENNKFSENKNNAFLNFNPEKHCAYHFDAVKLGQWLKTNYCIPRGVEVITDTVESIETNEDGVESLTLKSGHKIVSDLYVDCTGFKSLLLGKTLKSEFTSYSHLLPNNRAWAVHLPYKEKEKELEGFTNCTAIENGWCWNIPLWSRIGTGYVYSDEFISPDDAKEEFKKYLMSDKVAIPRTREEVDNLNYKDINMRIGMHKQSFYKNVVAIGLSAGFIEPLESNGLLSVHVFLFKLMRCLLRESVTQFDRDGYNHEVYNYFKRFAEFVSLHYALSIRNDTKYWKEITDKIFDSTLYKDELHHVRSYSDISIRKYSSGELETNSGISYISIGMNYIAYDRVMDKCDYFWDEKKKNKDFDKIFFIMEQSKQRWKTESDRAPSLYKYLKQHIHNN